MARPFRILLTTGELSGDYHAAWLVRALRREAATRGWELTIAAIGSTNLAAVVDELWEDSSTWAGIGIFESLRRGPKVALAFRRLTARMRQWQPDLVIAVDYRVFNMSVLRAAKRLGARTAYYFAPVHWGASRSRARKVMVQMYEGPGTQRRKPDRFDQVASVADLVLLAYPLSEANYARAGANYHYLGHPLGNALEAELTIPRDTLRAEWLGPDQATRLLIGVFPGSRDQELRDLWPTLLAGIAELGTRHPDLRWYVSSAHPRFQPRLARDLATLPAALQERVTLVEGSDPNLLRATDVVWMKSGTAAQTALLLTLPMVTFYRIGVPPIIGPLVVAASRKLFIDLPYWTFPNLLANAPVVPELIQEGFTVATLLAATDPLLTDPAARTAQQAALAELRERLYRPDALTRAASLCLDLLQP